ncbi:MAG TPA: UDP-N-acetylmuramoyl-tripeptide--D-alanyl-D-alanine ligase [Candidatus Sulfotelmatobacter sp.]|nr:UDP-N-acetylmuramoyl-tripeptide--D-alanyl-D-alanine ligase [Candidatus Sulfotelmatobacter sp.]
MDKRSLKFIAEACGAEILAGTADTTVENVCTDSRRARAGDLFFAIKGENFDGHAFVKEVAEKKAAAVVVEQGKIPAPLPGCAVLAVDDTITALGKVAAAYRRDFALPVVCVCGSNGKTTTKELTAGVLRQKFSTLWSEASFNNNIGVPLTLLRLEKKHQAAVLEAGTNHPGELAPLVKMIRPGLGVLTNIGREHLEFFGDMAGVAREEGHLAELLPRDGTLFVNGDSEWTPDMVRRTRAQVVRVGFGEKNDWRADKVRLDKNGVTFRVTAANKEFYGDYRVPLLGRHQVLNSLFAMAVGAMHGMTTAEIQRGLAESKPAKMRMQFWEAGGIRVLDDAYNANADSMVAALETLRDLPLQGRRVAVLGDMAELGAHSEAAHAEVGRRAAELQIGQLFAVGKMAPIVAKAARDAGLSRVIEFENVEAAIKAVKSFLKSGDLVLLKASRSSRLERIAETLKSEK